MQQAIACKCEAGFCSVRNRELPKSMMSQCAAGHGDAVSAMIEVIDAGREKRRLAAAASFQNGKTIRVRRHVTKPHEPVGTSLEGNISRILKLKTGKGCGCSTLVTKMNAWGIRGCEANRVEIVDTLMQHREQMQISFAASAFAMAKEIGIVDSLRRKLRGLIEGEGNPKQICRVNHQPERYPKDRELAARPPTLAALRRQLYEIVQPPSKAFRARLGGAWAKMRDP